MNLSLATCQRIDPLDLLMEGLRPFHKWLNHLTQHPRPMEQKTLKPPLCSKHGCEKTWHKANNCKAGGRWRCRPCLNGWPANQIEYVRTEDKAPPTCEKHGCKKVWVKRADRTAGGAWSCRKCENESKERQRKANPEKFRAKESAWRKANPEKCRKMAKKKRKANPEGQRAKEHRREARKRNAASPLCVVTAEAIAKRKALIKGCAYCGADATLTLDHVVALNDGGLHVPSNLVGACSTCNSSKQDSPVEAWFRAQPFFSEQRWQRIQQITGQGQLSLV